MVPTTTWGWDERQRGLDALHVTRRQRIYGVLWADSRCRAHDDDHNRRVAQVADNAPQFEGRDDQRHFSFDLGGLLGPDSNWSSVADLHPDRPGQLRLADLGAVGVLEARVLELRADPQPE